jgi:HlyD family secretion protein
MTRLSLALAALLAAAPVTLRAESALPQPETAAPSVPAISVTTVGTRLLRDRVIASGLVGPVERVQVQPLIEGQPIEALLADVGDMVAEGQVLARLSATSLDLQDSQFQAGLAAARAQVAQAEAQLLEAQSAADEATRVNDRTRALKDRGNASQAAADQASANAISASARVVVARQSLEAARAQVSLAEAQLANVGLQLRRTEVKAPVAGRIVERNALVGAVASAAGQPMFVLVRDNALELNADVAEADIVRLAKDQPAAMRRVGGTETIAGRVRLVEPAIDPTSRLGRARIWVDPAAGVVQGSFLDAEVIVAEREAVAVPVTALGASPEGATVMRVRDGLVERVAVVTGIRDGGWIEIVSGLAAGDVVVAKAGAFVRDGDRINPIPVATN